MSPQPPPLPYEPKHSRPLSLWNPLDYAQLLYWIVFFPQALRWYVETFSTLPVNINGWVAVRQDRIQRNLVIQGTVITLLTASFFFWTLILPFSAQTAFVLLLVGSFVLLLFGLLFGGLYGPVYGVTEVTGIVAAFGLASILWYSLLLTINATVVKPYQGIFLTAFISSMFIGIPFGIAVGLIRSVVSGVTSGTSSPVAVSLTLGLLVTIFVAWYRASNLVYQLGFVAGFSVFFLSTLLRVETGLLAIMLSPLALLNQRFIPIQRVSPIEIPFLQRQLMDELEADWSSGLLKIEGLLRYSLQTATATSALRRVLEPMPGDRVLEHVAQWCSMPLYSWDAVFLLTKSRKSWRALRKTRFLNGLWLLPGRWRPQIVVSPEYDTPVRAACAAFWYLHRGQPAEALLGFERVRALKHGEELYSNAAAMAAAQACADLAAVGAWQPPATGEGALLRPQVQAALGSLGTVAQDLALLQQSRSRLQRSTALNRATGALNDLKQGLDECPTPERDILRSIAAGWLDLAIEQASLIGTVEVRERVSSPYIVGAVVSPDKLTGRQDIFERIQQIWDKKGRRDSLVIYGQRRVGKSSIVRNLLHFCHFSDDTALAVLNIQSVAWEDGLVDLCYQIGFALWKARPTTLPEPEFEQFEGRPLITLRSMLEKVALLHPERRYILILDEYEELEHNLPREAASEFVRMLRGWTQDYAWLVVALVGLHTLQERSADYFQPIFSWRPIPVGLLNQDAVAAMLEVQDDDFPLSYLPEAITLIHEMTGGQPLLVQLIGDSLVERFNQQLGASAQPPSPIFTRADVEAVINGNPQFEADSSLYFQGIWRQAAESPPGQHAVLRALAVHSEPRQIQAATRLNPDQFYAALDALKRHDIVAEHNGHVRYTVDLMRRWAAKGGPEQG